MPWQVNAAPTSRYYEQTALNGVLLPALRHEAGDAEGGMAGGGRIRVLAWLEPLLDRGPLRGPCLGIALLPLLERLVPGAAPSVLSDVSVEKHEGKSEDDSAE